jgi:hypothetical protein
MPAEWFQFQRRRKSRSLPHQCGPKFPLSSLRRCLIPLPPLRLVHHLPAMTRTTQGSKLCTKSRWKHPLPRKANLSSGQVHGPENPHLQPRLHLRPNPVHLSPDRRRTPTLTTSNNSAFFVLPDATTVRTRCGDLSCGVPVRISTLLCLLILISLLACSIAVHVRCVNHVQVSCSQHSGSGHEEELREFLYDVSSPA